MVYCALTTFIGVALILAGVGGSVKLGTGSFIIGGGG